MVMSFRGSLALALLGVLAACESPTKPPPAVSTVVLGPSVSLVDALGTLQYAVIVRDVNNNVLEGRPVTWSVDDTTIATISTSGLLTGKPNASVLDRNTFVRATVGGVNSSAAVAVRPSAAGEIDIVPFVATLQDGEAPTITAQVRDGSGNLLAGRTVTWTSRDTTSLRVSEAGVLTAVPFIGGGNRVVRVVANIGTVRDSTTVTVAPTAMTELTVFPQQPYVQAGWTKTLRIEGRTAAGSLVPGVAPTFSSSNTGIATVNASGVVTALNAVSGTTEIIASYSGVSDTITLTVDNCGAGPAGTYPLSIRFYGVNPPTPSVEAAFTCAANRIRAMIRQPVSLVDLNGTSLSSCTGGSATLAESTEGLLIYAKVDTIDGAGAVLGRAGPCFVRSTSRLPVVGVMEFDAADLVALEADGRLLPVIIHEMLHVVGIGTTWREASLNLWTGAVFDPGFLGLQARAACVNDHGGSVVCQTQVPIEDCVGIPGCGAGTLHGHWRESLFENELMTGYIENASTKNPLSRMTIKALADLGYVTDADQSNNYLIPGAAVMGMPSVRAARGNGLKMPAPRMPTHEIDRNGRMRPILY